MPTRDSKPRISSTFAVYLPPNSYKDDASRLRFYQNFSDRLRSLPGVQGVATVSVLPLTAGGNTILFIVEGRFTVVGAEDECNIRAVSPGYFSVMKIPLRDGRFVAPSDKAGTPPTVIVNQAFARRFFPGDDPVGKRIRFTYSPTNPFQEIVGVVGNQNANQLDAPMPPIIYTFFERSPDSYANYVVRTSGSAGDMISPVRAALHRQDAELPLIEPQTMDQIIAASPAVFVRRYPLYLLGSFAVLAITLAMVGLYGLVSFSVAQRTQEIGIRMALGAEPRDVLKMVVKQGMLLTVAGLAAGVAGALALTRFLSGFLYGVRPTDPLAFVEVSLILGVVALLASYIPARRATKVDPLVALRYE